MTQSPAHSLILSLAQAQSEGAPERFVPKLPDSDYFWLPNRGTELAHSIDNLFMYITWVSAISVMGIFAAMFYFCYKYRAKSREANQQALSQVDHSNALEITWSVLPFFFLISIFVWGFRDFVSLRTPPRESIEIIATGQKWQWTFKYPNGHVDSELHVPKGANVRVLVKSVDVLHSLFIPEFRVKMDAVPGRYTDLWFRAEYAGTFPVFCTEYCGKQHSDMMSQVTVHEGDGYEKWLQQVEELLYSKPLPEIGQIMYTKFGCGACHSVDGSPNTGPTFKGLWGKTETLTNGKTVVVDENYIRDSIFEPQKDIVQGYPNQMPSFKGQIKDKGIDGLIAYLKTLN